MKTLIRSISVILLLLVGFIKTNAQSGWSADLHVDHENYIQNTEVNVNMIVDLYDENNNLVQPQSNYKYEFFKKYILEPNPQWISYGVQWGVNQQGTHTYQDSTQAPEGKFEVKCKITLPGGTIINSDVITIPWFSVIPNQKKQNGSSFGTIDYWYKNDYRDNNGINTIYLPRHSSQVLRAETNVVSSEKYNYWKKGNDNILYNNFVKFSLDELLNTAMTSQFKKTRDATVRAKVDNYYLDILKFTDPWLRNYNEQPYGIRNQGLSAQPESLPNTSNNLSVNGSHQGVFLDQQIISGKPYYSIKIPTSITVGGEPHKINLINWETTHAQLQYPDQLETGVVFTDNNANVTANLKGSLLSNSIIAYKSGSQNKIVKAYGTLCSVYESMDKVWLETSDDNGQTWEISNGGKPLNGNTQAKNPSIATIPGTPDIAIVFQENNYGNKIRIMIINPVLPPSNNNFLLYDGIVKVLSGNYSDNATPVIAVEDISNYNSELYIIVWREVSGSATGGLYYRKLKGIHRVHIIL